MDEPTAIHNWIALSPLSIADATRLPLAGGIGCIAISGGIGCALNGIKLKALSIENGKVSRNPATAHKLYRNILGLFLRTGRARHTIIITNAPVRLIFRTLRNRLSIVIIPLVFVNQRPKLRRLL